MPTPTSREEFLVRSAGERTVPAVWHEAYWYARHEVAYAWTVARVRSHLPSHRDDASLARQVPVVADAGCGEGFGASMLARALGVGVIGLDYDGMTVAHVRDAYPAVSPVRGNLVALPMASSCLDVLVSLQTIEHLWDQAGFVAECARVLAPGGLLVVSTPDRTTFPPGNVYHHRELDAAELTALLASQSDDVVVRGIRHGERIAAWEAAHGDLVRQQVAAPPSAWPATLQTMVASVRADDFVVGGPGDLEGALDLLATAVAR